MNEYMNTDLMNRIGMITVVMLFGLVAACSDEPTKPPDESEKKITFQVVGYRTVQVWSHCQLVIGASAKSGATPSLSAPGLIDNALFVDSGNGRAVLDFCPSKDQFGEHEVKIIARTATEVESLLLDLNAIDRQELRLPLLPLSLGNRWIYQSVESRIIFDTADVAELISEGNRTRAVGSFSGALKVLGDTVVATEDSMWSEARGLQFAIPAVLASDFVANSRGECYTANVVRQISWSVGPVVVPAGRFCGCFVYTCQTEHECESGSHDIIVEEIFLKPGVGVVKLTQIRTSACGEGCSSRWELFSFDLD